MKKYFNFVFVFIQMTTEDLKDSLFTTEDCLPSYSVKLSWKNVLVLFIPSAGQMSSSNNLVESFRGRCAIRKKMHYSLYKRTKYEN